MDTLVDGALEWSALQPTDLDEVCALRAAIDWFDDPVETTPPHLLHERHREAEHPERDAVVGRDRGGTIVAYAWNVPRTGATGGAQVWLDGGVHPAERHHGIGRHLLDWQLARCEEWAQEPHGSGGQLSGRIWVGTRVDERVASRSALMRAGGLSPERWFVDLRCPLDAGTPHQVPMHLDTAHGRVDIVLFDPVRHGEATRLLHNETFSRLGGGQVDAAAWEASLRRADARQTCSWVALAGDEVIGYALNSVATWAEGSDTEGWTDRLGVAHSWRGQGIGSALLAASKACFAAAGYDGAGAGLDTRDREAGMGAFHRAGYQVSETVGLWSRELVRDADGRLRWEAPGRLG